MLITRKPDNRGILMLTTRKPDNRGILMLTTRKPDNRAILMLTARKPDNKGILMIIFGYYVALLQKRNNCLFDGLLFPEKRIFFA